VAVFLIKPGTPGAFRQIVSKMAGGMATYGLIFAALAYYHPFDHEEKYTTYELALNLQGPPSAREAFLKELDQFQVSFGAASNAGIGVYFGYFVPDDSGSVIRSKVSLSKARENDLRSLVATAGERTKSVLLHLDAPGLRLSDHMEADLRIEPAVADTAAKKASAQE
jgi:hypothetical protein